jgi:endonuclease YncB( thermonuclease family)
MVIVGLAMALALPAAAVAQETLDATVTRVIDGDTIEVQPSPVVSITSGTGYSTYRRVGRLARHRAPPEGV